MQPVFETKLRLNIKESNVKMDLLTSQGNNKAAAAAEISAARGLKAKTILQLYLRVKKKNKKPDKRQTKRTCF